MDTHTVEKAQDPFYTSKLEREKKVGLASRSSTERRAFQRLFQNGIRARF
jgi:hypothetical protein